MKFFTIFSCSIFLIIAGSSNSQVTTQWSNIYNGNSSDTDVVTSMVLDNQNNIIVTGYSNGNGTAKDFATVKYNPAGKQLWAAVYNNNEANLDDIASGVAADASGNIYVTGHSIGASSNDDYLTLKYSPSGDLLWISRYSGKGNDNDAATDIITDGLGNVYVTGYSVGSLTSEDYTTIKYNSAGAEQWISSFNNDKTDDIDIATCIALDNSGNVIVSGYSTGVGGQEDYATVKYNSSGDEIWSARYNGTGNGYDVTTGMTVDNSGNIIVTGYSLGQGSQEDYATVKYDSQGNQIWVKRYNGESDSYDISKSVETDAAGNVFVTGYSYDDVNAEDYLTIKYNPDGEELWKQRYNGKGNDYDIAVKLKVDAEGNSYVTGYSYKSGLEENYVTLKYNNEGILQWEQTFNNDLNGSDIATNLEVDNNGNVYVTGYSDEGATGIDYVTLKYSQTVGISQITNTSASDFKLNQNYPNPFNPGTVIGYQLAAAGFVTLNIYDMSGKIISELINERKSPGNYTIQFLARNLSSGIYYYSLYADGNLIDTKKMILLK